MANTATPDLLPVARHAIIVNPGNRVLLVAENYLTEGQLDDIRRYLQERFPGEAFSVVVGDEAVHTLAA